MNRFSSRFSRFKFFQMLHNIKRCLVEKRDKAVAISSIKKQLKANKKAVILLFTPTNHNLGDIAITYTVTKLLEANSINYIEITDEELFLLKRYESLSMFDGRKILLNGGGNIGTLWVRSEYLIRDFVLSNPNSKIIVLPNTIFYDYTDEGKNELQKSMMIYNNHKNIVFYAREGISFEMARNSFNIVKLCPDMVLSINIENNNMKRFGCLICLRNDIEKTLSDNDTTQILSQLKTVFNSNCKTIDMFSDNNYDISNRAKILEYKFDEFKQAQLVITDRLHAMIFSAITCTPCIVIDSKSPKIRGCYEWIKDLNYIEFCDDYSKISNIAEKLISIDDCKYDSSKFSGYYKDLLQTIKTSFGEIQCLK